jgi:hypothetical protein
MGVTVGHTPVRLFADTLLGCAALGGLQRPKRSTVAACIGDHSRVGFRVPVDERAEGRGGRDFSTVIPAANDSHPFCLAAPSTFCKMDPLI